MIFSIFVFFSKEFHVGDKLVCDCLSEYYFSLSCSVKVLNINSYNGDVNDLKQMKYFLRKLSCLELVEVRARATSTKAKLQIMADLLMLPRASPKCKIQVEFLPGSKL